MNNPKQCANKPCTNIVKQFRSTDKHCSPRCMIEGMAKVEQKKRKIKVCANKACRAPFTPASSLHRECCVACVVIVEKAKKDRKFRSETREAKKAFNEKDIRWQHKQCQPVFNRLRVLQELKWFADRGLEPTCTSCGHERGNDIWCNGHFKTVGSSSSLRYDPLNTYLQHNHRCNMRLSGDINGTATTHGYKQGLIKRFGIDEAQRIFDYCENHSEPKKWDWEQMNEDRKNWNIEIRKLEKLI